MITAILTCAGNGCRFGHNKLMKQLAGKPVFIRTVEQFVKAKNVDEIIIAVRKNEIMAYDKWLKKEGLKAKLVVGGEYRHLSAFNGLQQSKGDYILIHDGDRPLVTPALIRKTIKEVKKNEAVMVATKASTCIKYVQKTCLNKLNKKCHKRNCQNEKCDKYTKAWFVEKCLPRPNTWLGQTPHAFKRKIILKAYKKAIKDKNFAGMDDCDFVSRLGIKVKVIQGEINNLKITYPSDLINARQLYKLTINKNG